MTAPQESVLASAQQERAAGTAPGVWRTVVGVDGSAGSLAALRWAVTESRLRGGTVHAVMAWQHPSVHNAGNVMGVGMDPSQDSQAELASAIAADAARVAAETDDSPDVAITSAAVEGHPVSALLEAAEGADLLVVGSRGHGGFLGALLGSVSQHVVAHATCPVVVVPAPDRSDSS